MNSLFSYRLIIALGLMVVLILNTLFDFWTGSKLLAWVLATTYLTWVCTIRIINIKAHDNGHQIVIDLLIWTLFFSLNEGVSNPLIWCLLLPPLVASIKQGQNFAWLTTICANFSYLLLWFLQDQIHPQGHHQLMQSHVIGMWLGFIVVSLMLTWVVTTLMSQLRVKNQAIIELQHKQTEDFNLVKMATLATSLAHELGSPLHSIKLLVNELSYELKNTNHASDCQILDEQVSRCKRALDDLTKITAASVSTASSKIALKVYITDVLTSFTTTHPKITFHNLIPEGMCIMCDDLLPLVFLNVINNSIAAESKNIFITAELKKHVIDILIKDDGAGSNHSKENGLGIGLKLAQRIMEAMSGQLIFNCNSEGAETQIQIPQAP